MPRLHHGHHGSQLYTLNYTTFPQRVIMSQTFASPPPSISGVVISVPAAHVLLVTLNRPKQLNALRRESHYLLDTLWTWYENEPSLRCAVLTGTGRAFCAGADLKEWYGKHADGAAGAEKKEKEAEAAKVEKWTDRGFGGMSNRRGKKPIIAAVNGLCFGGGMEMVINCDMVLASESARFGLPEVSIGVIALAGALPRLTRLVGRARASEMALTGRNDYTPQTMLEWGIINSVVHSPRRVVNEAVRWAAEVASKSPDSIIVTRAGLMGGWDPEDPCASTDRVGKGLYAQMDAGENMREGVASFIEKRKPVWKDSKL